MQSTVWHRLLAIFLILPVVCLGQPIDLIVPDSSIGDSLSSELRTLQAIERDLSLEKLTYPKKRLDALLELGELRLSQGKLEEAQRFFEMVLEKEPQNRRANTGLALVHYHSGRFGQAKMIFDKLVQLYPLSDALKENLEKVKNKISSTAEIGIQIHEDNRGVTEIISSLEGFFPSYTYPKLSGRYRLENWDFEDTSGKANSRVLSATFEYTLNHRNRLALTYAPETIFGNKEIVGYCIHGVTGTPGLSFVSYYGRNVLKENVQTIKSALFEDYLTFMLIGEIHERLRISQSLTTSDISDDNGKQTFNTKFLYFITRRGIPLLSLELDLLQTGYEKQLNNNGKEFPYWTPSDFRRGKLSFSWERGVGARWWWGIETHFISSTYRVSNSNRDHERGLGFMIHSSYRFETGRLHAQFTDTIKEYYRERMLSAFGSFDF